MTDIVGWHAHIYTPSPESRDPAGRLREAIAARFPTAVMGRWHDKAVGPHPWSMYQVAFAPDLFPTLVPFLALHREGLTILVHPDTLRPKADHAHHALWMGAVLPLDLGILPETSEKAP